jgi:hypothetical protein
MEDRRRKSLKCLRGLQAAVGSDSVDDEGRTPGAKCASSTRDLDDELRAGSGPSRIGSGSIQG